MAKNIFIGSSSENLDVAYAIQENLEEHGHSPTVWTQGIFNLSETIIESLVSVLSQVDFAIFVFNPDDVTILRDETLRTVRDNIIFELGLFFGALGRHSCFIIMPNMKEKLHLPTDLLGINIAKYNPKREDGNLFAALGPACNKINRSIKKQTSATVKNEPVHELCKADWRITERKNSPQGKDILSNDFSNLFFLMLSVLDCGKSRILIADLQTESFPDIQLEAMYDLMGSWDLLIKFRTQSDHDEFKDKVYERLIHAKMMEKNPNGVFGRQKLVNILTQSPNLSGLIHKKFDQPIRYTILDKSQDYENHRSSRAFIFVEAKGEKASNQRNLFIRELENSISDRYGISIIESICEGEDELIIETFSSCSQSNQINHLNKALEPVLTVHGLQKYTLSCYHYDESGLKS